MKVGYARVSTLEQNLDLQVDALKAHGCDKIIQEKVTSTKKERPLLTKLIAELKPGDTLVIWKLDRLGRNLKDLIHIIYDLLDRDIALVSLQDPIDTTTPYGKLVFNIFASLSEFERDVIKARTLAGLSSARARGRLGGRPKGLSKEAIAKSYAAENLYRAGKLSINEICAELSISRGTLYAYLRHRNVDVSPKSKKQEAHT
jgi:DNA invertase Pin-like site-specific DNA recombinase